MTVRKSNKSRSANVVAIIPARSGSKGVPGKNIRLLEGYPLISYSIIAASMAKEVGRIIVSTDSEEIAEISRRYGAEVPFIRPAEYAGDKSPDIDFVLHAINWFKKNENEIPEYLVHLRPTTPLRVPAIIDRAVSEICGRPEATSLRSGHPASESPFKWFLRDENGYFKGILSTISNEDTNRPRQSFPEVYIPDGYVDVLKPDFILKSGILHGDRMIGFVSPPCVEVDTKEDFEYLQYELRKAKDPVFGYLKQNFPKGG